MAFDSSIVDDKPGKGHTDHGNGKGHGHEKHAEHGMKDGVYTVEIRGVHNDGSAFVTGDGQQTANPLPDGSTFYTQARSGSVDSTHQGLLLDTDNANGRLRAGVVYDQDQIIKLGDLNDVSFDFRVTSLDPGSQNQYSPAFRITIDGDGNLATTADRGQLVYEFAYNNTGPVPIGTTVHVDVDQSTLWQRANNTNYDQIANMTTFADWSDANGYTPAGGVHFDQNSLVLGFEVGLGSGPGSGTAYVNHVQVGGVTYDFLA